MTSPREQVWKGAYEVLLRADLSTLGFVERCEPIGWRALGFGGSSIGTARTRSEAAALLIPARQAETHVFENTGGDFSALRAAKAWARKHGYVYGSMQRDAPIGLMPAETCYAVAKWRNLSLADRAQLAGVIKAGAFGFRGGPATVEIYTGEP